MATPRQTLQYCIEQFQQMQKSNRDRDRERARKFLDKHGETVEAFVENGWRVAKVPVAMLRRLGFRIEPPNDDKGHQNVIGTPDMFEDYTLEFHEESEILDPKECVK